MQGGVAFLAFSHAKKAPFHKPLAYYALWVALVDFGRVPLEMTRPHRGLMFILDEVSFLSLPVGLCVTVIRTIRKKWSWITPEVCLWVTLAIALGYPYSASFWVYAVVQAVSIGVGWFYIGRALWRGKCWLGLTEQAIMAYLSAETAVLGGYYFANWPAAMGLMFALNISLLALHLAWEASMRVKSRQSYD